MLRHASLPAAVMPTTGPESPVKVGERGCRAWPSQCPGPAAEDTQQRTGAAGYAGHGLGVGQPVDRGTKKP
jgi:hypothetical protein